MYSQSFASLIHRQKVVLTRKRQDLTLKFQLLKTQKKYLHIIKYSLTLSSCVFTWPTGNLKWNFRKQDAAFCHDIIFRACK